MKINSLVAYVHVFASESWHGVRGIDTMSRSVFSLRMWQLTDEFLMSPDVLRAANLPSQRLDGKITEILPFASTWYELRSMFPPFVR